jgi:hypothetical protein
MAGQTVPERPEDLRRPSRGGPQRLVVVVVDEVVVVVGVVVVVVGRREVGGGGGVEETTEAGVLVVGGEVLVVVGGVVVVVGGVVMKVRTGLGIDVVGAVVEDCAGRTVVDGETSLVTGLDVVGGDGAGAGAIVVGGAAT